MKLTDEIRDRIKLVVDNTGLSQKKFSEKINYSSNKITEILKGSNKTLSRQFVQLLEDHFGVNPKWLETGIGSPCILSIQANDLEEQLLLKDFRLLDRPNKEILTGICKLLYQKQQMARAEEFPHENQNNTEEPFQQHESPWQIAGNRSPYGKKDH